LRRNGEEPRAQEKEHDIDDQDGEKRQAQPGNPGPSLPDGLFFQRNLGEARGAEHAVIMFRDAFTAEIVRAFGATGGSLALRMIRTALPPEKEGRDAHKDFRRPPVGFPVGRGRFWR
jgi:hypothetical protein